MIWTAEFASQKWLYDMTPYMEDKKADYIEAPVETVTYDGKIWGAPETSDAAFIYYRTDLVDSPPETWQEVYELAVEKGGIVYQGAATRASRSTSSSSCSRPAARSSPRTAHREGLGDLLS